MSNAAAATGQKKRIFVLNGHPGAQSLNKTLAESYASAAEAAGFEVKLLHLADLAFDMDFEQGDYVDFKPLEADLQGVIDAFNWADHVVMTTPMWWGGLPAKLKGMFDRAFVPGTAFDPRNPNKIGMPAPLLTGKTGHVVLTSDTPSWFLRWVYGNPIVRTLKHQIFGYVGIKPLRFTQLYQASHPKEGQVEAWINQVEGLGSKGL